MLWFYYYTICQPDFQDDKLLMNTICDYVDQVLPSWQQSPLNHIELALSLVFFIGEVVSVGEEIFFISFFIVSRFFLMVNSKLVLYIITKNTGYVLFSVIKKCYYTDHKFTDQSGHAIQRAEGAEIYQDTRLDSTGLCFGICIIFCLILHS